MLFKELSRHLKLKQELVSLMVKAIQTRQLNTLTVLESLQGVTHYQKPGITVESQHQLKQCTCVYTKERNLLEPNTINIIQLAGAHSKTNEGEIVVESSALNDDPDSSIRPALDAYTPIKPSPNFVNIVPGKGPPPEPPVDCCMSGCANCVWIQYAEELKQYFSANKGNTILLEALEEIDNPGLKMFLKMEMGLL